MTRPKHVMWVGRWRIAWRIGRHRFGIRRYAWDHYVGALGFIWFNVMRVRWSQRRFAEAAPTKVED